MRLALATAFILLSFQALTGCARNAVERVHAGSPLLDGSRIVARTDTFSMVNGAEPAGMMVMRTAALGDTALLRVERVTAPGGQLTDADSFAVRARTVEPLFSVAGVSRGHSLRFHPGRVAGAADGTPVDVRLDPPAFYANSTDLLLAALPLTEGRRFTLSLWNPFRGAHVMEVRVGRTEPVTTVDGGTCEVWRVETDGPGGAAVYWVERRTRSLVAFAMGEFQIRILRHPECAARREPAGG
jgi:hypothetical protein